MRAVAVVPVVLWHAGYAAVPGGFVGVDIFFVISGFLIAGILYAEITDGRFSILRFYERRARRILPALFLVIAATYPFAWAWMLPPAFSDYSRSILAATFFVSNIFFWLTSNYFGPGDAEVPLVHTWSLSVEEQFYLAFPVLLLLLWKVAPRRVLPVLLGVALASLALSQWLSDRASEANFFLAPTRAFELLAGAVAAIWCHRRPDARVSAGGQALSAAGLAMMLASFFLYDSATPIPSAYALLPVMGAVMMLVWGRRGTWAAAVLSWPPLVGIGLVSYSLYLWHQPVFALARTRLLNPPTGSQMAALSLLSLMLAILSWRFVERPFRQRGAGAPVPLARLWQAVAGGAVGLMLMSSVGIATDGARFRFPPTLNALADRFDRALDERLKIERVGLCELNTSFLNIRIEQFERSWNCVPPAGAPTTVSNLAIYGDSHATDIASALRFNGVDVLYMAEAGCSLSPLTMKSKCRRVADFMKEQIAAHKITDLWLVNYYEPNELTPEAVASMIAYWKATGTRLTIFSPTPEFLDLKNRMLRTVGEGRPLSLVRHAEPEAEFFRPEVQSLLKAAGVRVIDSGAIFCKVMPDCLPLDDGQPLMIDDHHLTLEGARRFGAVLVADQFDPEREDGLPPVLMSRADR
ncbi:MAG: acyltransferase [Proteobacteria bacterium]|nr:acyltransferase [Pseudomonadota bacterium]MBS0574782.1 acyltransferase [Pseudomonadota bacterium]